MATFAQYFKVCKEEAEAAEVVAPSELDSTEGEIRSDLAETSSELNETVEQCEKTEDVIADTQEQLDAQKQALEKPEEVTPAQVVLAAESFRANLRMLGVDSTYIKSLSHVNSEAITASPAQVLSLITVDMEGFLDTAKKVGAAIWEKIKALINKIIDLFKKVGGFIASKFNNVKDFIKKKREKGETTVSGITDAVINQYPAVVYCLGGSNFRSDISTLAVKLVGDTNANDMSKYKDFITAAVSGDVETAKKEAATVIKGTEAQLLKIGDDLIYGLQEKSILTMKLSQDDNVLIDMVIDSKTISPDQVKKPSYADKEIKLDDLEYILQDLANKKNTFEASISLFESIQNEMKGELDNPTSEFEKFLLNGMKLGLEVCKGKVKTFVVLSNFVSKVVTTPSSGSEKTEEKTDNKE